MKKHLTEYVRYNLWANRKTVTTLSQYAEEVITQKLVSSFPSIQLTLYHIWDAETIWLKRLRGKSLSDFPSKTFTGSLQEGYKKTMANSRVFLDFVENQPGEYFDSTCRFRSFDGTDYEISVREIIHHCMNHSTYHSFFIPFLQAAPSSNILFTCFKISFSARYLPPS